MIVCTLASGSTGNCLFLESSHTKILVDAGISLKQIQRRLKIIGVDVSEIDAIITTHEHDDHTKAITMTDIPVYVTSTTCHIWKDRVSSLREFDSGSFFEINDLFITPFSVPHDAIDPVGFTIETNDAKVGIVTDIGSVTSLVVERLKGSNILVLESNHDSQLLLYSNYPWELKQRIKSNLGHLSNKQSSSLLNSLFHEELRYVVLAHLSESNNSPEFAYKEAKKVTDKWNSDRVSIHIAPRKSLGEVLSFDR